MNDIKASKQTIREHNLGLIIKNVLEHGEITRSKISKNTGLARSTISGLVTFLISKNILFEHKKGKSEIGKKPTIIRFNNSFYCFIIIIVDIEIITTCLANISGEILYTTYKKNYPRKNREQILKNIFTSIELLLGETKIDLSKIYLFSIGTHGVVNHETNMISNAPYLKGWSGTNIVDILKSKYKKDAIIEKDVNLSAIGEHWKNHYSRQKNIIFITIDHGVGAGIIINDKLITGKKGRMGEIGYLPISTNRTFGELKNNRVELGLFESVVNINGIVKRVKEEYRNNPPDKENKNAIDEKKIDFEYICNNYQNQSNSLINNIIDEELIPTIAIGITSIISVIESDIIIINGEILKLGDSFMSGLIKAIYAITPFRPEILVSKLKENGPVEGAIKYGIDFLKDKLYKNIFSLLD